MVLLTVKGTTFPDEFVVECTISTTISPEFVHRICRTQNFRHQLRLQLLSAGELLAEANRPIQGTDPDGRRAAHASSLIADYAQRVESMWSLLKDAATPVTLESVQRGVDSLRASTAALFPDECTHPDGDDAAVCRLAALLESPKLDEALRPRLYHCRAVMDRTWRQQEWLREETAALWFCGKPMDGDLARYAGGRERSRLTVKLHPREGPAPSGEPRISYADQRALSQHMRERREGMAALEDSELRDRVVAQARGRVVLAAAQETVRVEAAQLRPIHPKREEREVGS